MTHYRAKKNEIVDEAGRQVAVVLASGCTAKEAREMAAYCAQQMNHAARDKQRRASIRAAAAMAPGAGGGWAMSEAPMTLTGDLNVPDMPMTDAQVNHLRRLLAWMRCEWMLDPDMQRGMMNALETMHASGDISDEYATAEVARRAEQINQVPAYVRQAVKMLTKALRDHERRAGVVDAEAR